MATTTRTQNRYDHRLKELVRSTRDTRCTIRHGVPPSTARGWLKTPATEVVTIDVLKMDAIRLQQEILQLRARIQKLNALLRVLLVALRLSGYSLNRSRVPDGKDKRMLLRAIERSRSVLPLRSLLRVIRLSQSRYHAWNRKQQCELDDGPSCPQTSPHQLTPEEVATIEHFVTCNDYRHVPTSVLTMLAQRMGKVFASASSWHRLVRNHKWRRPRQRVHPAKPTVGIRASKPNGIWHIDTTVIRLLDGSRAYLHAVIDNFSRRILSWKVVPTFDPATTTEILLAASKGIVNDKPMLMTDGGAENVNGAVDELVESGLLNRVLAQTEIMFSNSLIESWWRVLKHQWLYLNTLDTVRAVEKLVAFYVREHNSRLPHSAFRGQTPDEMYFGTGGKVPSPAAATW
jgi:transposase InsO family protein